MEDQEDNIWYALAASVKGDNHKRAGKDNQDAVSIFQGENQDKTWTGKGLQLIVSVADGHGDALSFRSQEGADLAIKAVEHIWESNFDSLVNEPSLITIRKEVEERLPKDITIGWNKGIFQLLEKNPISINDLEILKNETSESRINQLIDNPLLAYGTTILSVMVSEKFLIFIQLGDGDILTVSDSGIVERPLPHDDRLFANSTTSLSQPNAGKDFRVLFRVISSDFNPAMILLSTDGLANSFRGEKDFLQVGFDLFQMVKENEFFAGWETIKTNLPNWLEDISANGSGDDITQAILARPGIFKRN